MCTRYVFTDPAEVIRDLFSITAPLPNWPPYYNTGPTTALPAVRQRNGRIDACGISHCVTAVMSLASSL